MALTDFIKFRVSPERKQKFKQAAAASKLTLSKWVTRAADQAMDEEMDVAMRKEALTRGETL